MPLFREKLCGWTARSVYGEKPKYIASGSGVFKSRDELMLPDPVREYDLVVVEDVLSAIRVGRTCPTRSILGTTIRDREAELTDGLPSNARIAVWLDGDKAGRKGREQVVRKLSLLGMRVTRINTPKDPKKYSNREIRRLLSST